MTKIDVGDAFELTFTTTPSATVDYVWLDPGGVTVESGPVTETPPGSGLYPKTFLPTVPGMWQVIFTAAGTVNAVESFWTRATSVTGPPPLASLGDVVAQFGTMNAAQQGVTNTLLRAASALLRQTFPQLDAQIAAGRINPDVAALAVTNMILRVLRNPNGLRAETVGPFSRTYDTTYAAGLLVVTDLEAGILVPPPVVVSGAGSGVGVGTIRVTPGLGPRDLGRYRPWSVRSPYGRW